MADFSHARDRMVEIQIAGRGVRDQGVLEAMRAVPREAFVESGLRLRRPPGQSWSLDHVGKGGSVSGWR